MSSDVAQERMGVGEGGSVMEILKTATREAHTAAERHPLQASMFRGTLARETYAAYLGQLLCVHRALERSLVKASAVCARVGAVVREERFREGDLSADLAAFGVDPASVRPGAAATAFAREAEGAVEARPVWLLGPFYVLEGSTNGGRFIARAVRKAYDLTPGMGDRYLDPYGESQPEHWASFKRDMGQLTFDEGDVATLVGAADRMFLTIAAIGDELVGAEAR